MSYYKIYYNKRCEDSLLNTSIFWLFILVLFIPFGCTTTRNVPVEKRSETYNKSKKEVFNTVKTLLVEEGYTIREISYESGIINTGPKTDAFRKAVQAVVTKKSEDMTKLVLTLDYSYYTEGGYSNTMYGGVGSEFYDKWFKKIEERL